MQRITASTVLDTIYRIAQRNPITAYRKAKFNRLHDPMIPQILADTFGIIPTPGEEPTVATDLHDVTCCNCRETFVIDEEAFIDGLDQDGTWMCEGCWNAPPASALAEIEDGPYDPSQDCCPCDWNAPCTDHDTKEEAITRDPLFSYMIAEAHVILAASFQEVRRLDFPLINISL